LYASFLGYEALKPGVRHQLAEAVPDEDAYDFLNPSEVAYIDVRQKEPRFSVSA